MPLSSPVPRRPITVVHPTRVPVFALLALLCAVSTAGRAQPVAGAGSDARPLPKGAVRIGISGNWDSYDRVHTADGTEPMLARLSTDALGIRALPQLAPAQEGIRTLSGIATFNLSLGPLEATGNPRASVTPLALDVGITNRLSLGLLVPYVESRDNVQLLLNRGGTGATVGQNPAFSATAGATARTTNGTLLRQLDAARTTLAAEIARCAAGGATGCDAIRANPTGAQQLVQWALETQTAIAAVYGDSLRGGSPVVPISASPTQVAIAQRIGSLREGFAGYGVTGITDGAAPAPATIVNGPGAVTRIANDTAYGLDYEALGGIRRAGIGDIDLTASFLWLNTLGARPAQWLTVRGLGVRSMVTAGWRFGVAGADRTNTAFDIPIGDGTNAFLARSTTDLVLRNTLWLSGTIRLVQPFSDQAMLRRPVFVDTVFFIPSTVGLASRSLGRRVEAEVAPRFAIGQFFGISGGYLYRRADENQYAFAATDSLPAATYTTGARTSQAYMVAVTFSTMSSFVRNRSKWPIEVLYVHTEPLTGTGDAVPAMASDRLELRVYTGFPRR